MPTRAYTLRPEYEGQLVGGTILAGPDYSTMDLAEALKEGDGEIVTDSTFLQGVLENVGGAEGLLFNVSDVEGDKRKPLQTGTPPATGEPHTLEQPREIGQGVEAVPAAQHGEISEYAQLTKDEIKATLDERHVPYNNNATKDELIAALESSDAEGVGSGS